MLVTTPQSLSRDKRVNVKLTITLIESYLSFFRSVPFSPTYVGGIENFFNGDGLESKKCLFCNIMGLKY